MFKELKKIVRQFLNKIGYQVSKINASQTSMFFSLKSARDNLNIIPKSIIDVGAAQGKWTKEAIQVWPAANYTLIEPLDENLEALNQLAHQYKNISYHLAVAGVEKGQVFFSVSDDLDGSGIYGEDAENTRRVTVVKLDDVVQTKGPYLLKLDTHGYEIPIFEGASNILQETELIVVEVYGYYVSPTAKLFPDICKYLDEKGFRLVDIVDIMKRPSDKTFWQADAFFIRENHPIFNNNKYKG